MTALGPELFCDVSRPSINAINYQFPLYYFVLAGNSEDQSCPSINLCSCGLRSGDLIVASAVTGY